MASRLTLKQLNYTVYVLLLLHCIAVIETHEGVKNESFKITKIIGRLTLTA